MSIAYRLWKNPNYCRNTILILMRLQLGGQLYFSYLPIIFKFQRQSEREINEISTLKLFCFVQIQHTLDLLSTNIIHIFDVVIKCFER